MSSANATCKVEYRAIPNFPGYKVGDDGSILSCWDNRRMRWIPNGAWRPLKPAYHKDGYRLVCLQRDGRGWGFSVHRLVLEAFVGPCPDGMSAAHNNGIPDDSRLSNLRWDTHANNCADKVQHGTSNRGEKHWFAKLTKSQVLDIRSRTDEPSAMLADEFGVTRGTIQEIRQRRRWKHLPE